MAHRKYSILIVDDNALNIAVLSDALANEYTLLTAEDGRGAVQVAVHEGPDLILLDVMMPDMDGFSVCRNLKANPLTRSIPVIFLSGRDDVKSKTDAFECGGVDYITKPFEILEVTARVELHLELMRAKRALERQNLDLEERVQERTRRIRDIQRARYESLNNLADAVAHQVRNPVVAIGGMARLMMRRHPQGDSEREYLTAILDEAVRLEEMVRSVTDFTALTMQEKKRVDINHAVRKAREMAMEQAPESTEAMDVAWEVELAPADIAGNSEILSRGLRELLKNCLEALAQSGRADARIEIRSHVTEGFYRIEITDDGPGIPAENLPYVADPFFTTKAVGVGMGLAMAARVAEEHEGAMRIDSKGTGTRVIMDLSI